MHSGSVLSGLECRKCEYRKCRFYLLDRWGTCTYTGSKGSFFRCLEALEGTFVRTHTRQSCLRCILEVFWRGQNDVFLKFGDLGGDFYKETHEAKLFGMHIGSVLSRLEAGNVNNDREILKEECELVHWRGQK